MAKRKPVKKPTIKKPKMAQEIQALKISTNLMAQEMATLKPALRLEVQAYANTLQRYLERIEARQIETPVDGPASINETQLNQLAMAVNKIAAYAAAMDETKKTMIKLTSKRIAKLEKRAEHLRVRMKRLEG